MSAAREQILAGVRAAKGNPDPSSKPIARAYRRTDERSHDALVTLFCERVGEYRAEVARVDTGGLAAAITAAAARHHAERLAAPPQLPNAWRPSALELIPDHGLTPRELDALDGVITGCTVAVAETGTLALTAGPHEGRRQLSLVPDLHICVVTADQVVGLVPEAIARLGQITHASRAPVTLISGPSATSDIELQRVEGVHGPRKLVVLMVVNEQSADDERMA